MKDKTFELIAHVLNIRVPQTMMDIARATGVSRATAYRTVTRMESHFPIVFTRGPIRGRFAGTIMPRRSQK